MTSTSLVMKYNLSCGNRVNYFSKQWEDHNRRQRQDVMTDVTLIGLENNGNGFKSVKVVLKQSNK